MVRSGLAEAGAQPAPSKCQDRTEEEQSGRVIAHQTIQNWFSRLAKFGGNNIDSNANKARFTIFKFKLQTVDNATSNFAS